MSLNLKKHKKDLLFLPLGGSGEIGMNLNLYYMDGKWLMIDFGAGFAEEYFPGIDMTVPDISFISERKENLVGLVLTHAHEDHLGAIVHLWQEFDCPIFATPFTAAFLREKIKDSKNLELKPEIIEVDPGSEFQVGPFDIEMVELTHSVPEMNAIFLRTQFGNVFHSGDWKLDPKPMVGPEPDEEKIKKYGDEGVLAMVSDSTNVFSPGTSGSEGELRKSLEKIIADCDNMVMVTTFASNVARIETIAKSAQKCGRKVVLAGRSLWRITQAAKDSGYLTDAPEFLEDTEISNYPRDQILVISTGCQGEPRAATHKIASDAHKYITLRTDDTVIFSSKIIPGNDKRIFRLFNRFAQKGVNVITERDHFVHVSGHPNKDDLEKMYGLVRPQIAIPVHGEDVHMLEHTKLAKQWGVKEAVKVENGSVIKLAPGKPEKVAMVEAGELGIDGNFLLAPDSSIIRMRRKLQRDGIVCVTLDVDKNGLKRKPTIFAPGVLDDEEDKEIFDDMIDEITEALDECFRTAKKNISHDRVFNLTRSAIKRVLRYEVGKNPPIQVKLDGGRQ